MGKFSFTPRGVCSAQIDFEIEDNIVKNIRFHRGCSGNTQGVAKLAEGMPVSEVIKRLKGVGVEELIFGMTPHILTEIICEN